VIARLPHYKILIFVHRFDKYQSVSYNKSILIFYCKEELN